MSRLINCLFLAVMIVAAVIVYDLKHRVENASMNVARLEAEIEKERDAIALLNAEWSHLTQPARLQELVDRYGMYFELQAIGADQIATANDIPIRPLDLGPDRDAPLGGYAGGPGLTIQ